MTQEFLSPTNAECSSVVVCVYMKGNESCFQGLSQEDTVFSLCPINALLAEGHLATQIKQAWSTSSYIKKINK